jgi:hypothetical protein
MSPRPRTKARATPVTFRGPPNRLTSLVPLPGEPEALQQREARLEGAEVRALGLRPLAREGVNMGKLTIRLPKSTPPGTYAGSVALGGEQVPIVAEVEPRPRLEANPRRLRVEATPGAEVAAEVVLVNTGNVPCDVPSASTFCIFDGSGVDHAFWVALASDPPKGRQRIDVLLDDLAGSHGGLVEVRARAEKGSIAPGDARTVELALRFSDRLQAGHSYAGAWEAEGVRVPIRVSVPEQKRRRKAQ